MQRKWVHDVPRGLRYVWLAGVTMALGVSASAQPVPVPATHGKYATDAVGVCELSQNRDVWDTKVLWLTGKVTSVKNKKSSRLRKYTLVQVKDLQGNCFVRFFFLHRQNFLTHAVRTLLGSTAIAFV
jgi:hypothetical protein